MCNHCNKTFSRKWNALRHNNMTHHGLAIIYDKTTGFVFKNSEESNNKTNFDPLSQYEIKELNIINIFGRIMQPFTEYEKELDGLSESQKINNLSALIVGALSSTDPVKMIQDNLYFIRSAKGKAKIISYVAKSMNTSNVQAEQYLNRIITRRRARPPCGPAARRRGSRRPPGAPRTGRPGCAPGWPPRVPPRLRSVRG